MKFECEKSLLASAIEGVSRAITNRSAIPVLEGIYLKAEGFNLTLTGYDMEMGITTTIECNVLVPGETVLEAKLLLSMVSPYARRRCAHRTHRRRPGHHQRRCGGIRNPRHERLGLPQPARHRRRQHHGPSPPA